MYARFASVFAALSLALLASSTHAQDESTIGSKAPSARVTVAPLRLELDGEQLHETLRVINPSDRPIGIQVRAFGWTQTDGEDVYAPTTDVLVSPAIVVIEPGKTQFFRVQRRALPPAGERRYRVAIDQLPDPELAQSGTAMTRIRFTIPLFVDRATAAPAQLDWSVKGDTLRVANLGQQSARMVSLALSNGVNAPVEIQGASLHYVHGGSWHEWKLPGGCPTGQLTLQARIEGDTHRVQVPATCS
ncbi:fimbrial biogenesis chaperone [Qipengyuania qiaonensis]|uniref:Fimbria/pilus periplasmic chaperone n=1 Tax=Qipengyuania qiaonensis TaxID=2867240 RepID=A0ABS7J4Q4_9SPHN|nr:fimbria/pilus periplasmic chaperone [Qipengyuania qiaonensis]MBX7482252.1 fimbria/pilus periplasmic chaperone [Qipengyuania qiaonensis]